ncbi:MAG: type II toxin-antitoxin system VapC family toxin [Verrucomicrobia bacterium]|nr:type II toxin-antitoxin system VapC family toxin [Verrucomicrobiota bacterium]
MAWLLDTNAWIVYLKTPQSPIRTRLQTLRPSDLVLCSVVKAELLHGAEKYGNRERRLGILRELFAPYASLPFDDAAAAQYGQMRHELEVGGNVIGPNDLMIAAIALANNHTLVTHNTAEFSRVPGLALEDWQ